MSQATTGILTFQDLQQITGYQRRSDVERSLIDQGVRLFRGRTGPWTTLDLINHAGGVSSPSAERYESDIL
ncbi:MULTISPECIES: DUF4224 domain-containing protein [Pseudomonas]|uniref:DUF4224 domain-containing protein n=1 Tax=Pseudomonas aphyarum TaxID=2942629 RepID=A0ABT5PP89_9PSED|nr:DUF4224 domain-containing protein [Pseudomonas aphyarum]MDD0969347.1 DUF4224 domain-containing protein [Pseudomonas aphyarum]MDD1125554.1 DUF4224 domain-containing protein [Pseudomonas aphyarum]